MIAFISSTPHQTWDAMVMAKKLFPSEKSDLYLIDDCANYLETIDLLKKENFFEDIVPCKVQDLFCAKYEKSKELCILLDGEVTLKRMLQSRIKSTRRSL